MVTYNISYYNHHWAISPNLYTKHPKLAQMFEITAFNSDSSGTLFIASTQGYGYPFYTTQYHTEKNPFEWDITVGNHSETAVSVTAAHSSAFVRLVNSIFKL